MSKYNVKCFVEHKMVDVISSKSQTKVYRHFSQVQKKRKYQIWFVLWNWSLKCLICGCPMFQFYKDSHFKCRQMRRFIFIGSLWMGTLFPFFHLWRLSCCQMKMIHKWSSSFKILTIPYFMVKNIFHIYNNFYICKIQNIDTILVQS